ncbi:DNA mismatch repair endonuclease MutL [Chitinivibrio alkaliphilus]|uniref:DNA mismatch repair protein MutL n=1 Tax=Chitinivibrio alkaliphilus ACht1 TaxID=1313304 RepID=U7DB92_9BACT|nr:DNA mismatch repair endonuclease MutL [Chitinivibrio alkaliphilus]ERP39272.1 DNA mismatch repair protein MutL [Chitinivibrio alkaliphilus ACht1]
MKQISLLTPDVVEQIAAGEVIERPASIVKELLENSIDAGATRITITIEEGGLSRIVITDNGMGIPQEELPLAIQRHATSKIRKSEDLYRITTLGFRGEALASISAVSRFEIQSSNIGDGMGWRLSVDENGISPMAPTEHLKGTTIECRDLFYNLPARKKFSKSIRSETMAVVKTIEQVVLAFPAIHFSATINGKKRYDTPSVDSPLLRIAQIAGRELAEDLIHVSREEEDYAIDLYISPPHKVQARPRYQSLFVNLRRVDNRSISHAVTKAFTRFISGHLKPNWFCYLDINPEKIDVNVHPTKAEIKFDAEQQLFSFVYHGVETEVNTHLRQELTPAASESAPSGSATAVPELHETKTTLHSFSSSSMEPGQSSVREIRQGVRPKATEQGQTALSFLSRVHDTTEDHSYLGRGQAVEGIPCFQIHKRFILSPVKEGVIIIDQHAAHERILYEKILRELYEGGTDSQQLMFPVTITLTSEEKNQVMELRNYFEKTGFTIQDFGGNSIAVSAVPAQGFVKSTEIQDAIQEMLTAFKEERDASILTSLHKRFAASYACGAAIKFGRELRQEEMSSLMNALFTAENPHICPHGRPTITKMSLDELNKRFLR